MCIMIYQDHQDSIRRQRAHHASQFHNIGRMQTDGEFVPHIEHPGGAVVHCLGQLHPQTLLADRVGVARSRDR